VDEKPIPLPLPSKAAAPAAAPVAAAAEPKVVVDENFPCPEGASVTGGEPPAAFAKWCELPGGVKHGKIVRWYPNGHRAEEGEFKNGKKNGRWIEYYESGGERERSEWRKGVKSW
jgi:hypothetical protein